MKSNRLSDGEIVELLLKGDATLAGKCDGQAIEQLYDSIWQRLSQAKSAQGFNNLGVLFDVGFNGITRDCERAIKSYSKAVEFGSHVACDNLGFLFEEQHDESATLAWWQRGAELRTVCC